jgi:ADP-ribose pyrophosphatase YjhB (NUDIX family)
MIPDCPKERARSADDRAVKMIRDSQIPWLKQPFTNAELREALEAVLRNANPQAAL